STTVRTPRPRPEATLPHPPKGPAPLRATFRTLEAAAPTLGAAMAERLWFRLPDRPSAERRERFSPECGSQVTVILQGCTERGVAYEAEGAPTAYLVHGWGGCWHNLSAHVRPLVAAGYRVVAYDAPSHGSSLAGGHGALSSTILEMADA